MLPGFHSHVCTGQAHADMCWLAAFRVRLALVHAWLVCMGGVFRVLLVYAWLVCMRGVVDTHLGASSTCPSPGQVPTVCANFCLVVLCMVCAEQLWGNMLSMLASRAA